MFNAKLFGRFAPLFWAMLVVLLRHPVHDSGQLAHADDQGHAHRVDFGEHRHVARALHDRRAVAVEPARAGAHLRVLAELGRVVADGRLLRGVRAALHGLHEAVPDHVDLGAGARRASRGGAGALAPAEIDRGARRGANRARDARPVGDDRVCAAGCAVPRPSRRCPSPCRSNCPTTRRRARACSSTKAASDVTRLAATSVGVGPDLGRIHFRGTVMDLAGAFWNHAPVMREKMRDLKIQPPQLNSRRDGRPRRVPDRLSLLPHRGRATGQPWSRQSRLLRQGLRPVPRAPMPGTSRGPIWRASAAGSRRSSSPRRCGTTDPRWRP